MSQIDLRNTEEFEFCLFFVFATHLVACACSGRQSRVSHDLVVQMRIGADGGVADRLS